MHTFLRAVVTTAVAAGSLGVGAIAGAGRSEGSVGIRLLDVPERHRDDADARIYIVDDVEPGRSISRRVGVSNQTFTVLAVDVYAGAARLEGDQFVPLEPGATNDLTTWTSVEPARLTIDAGSEAAATVTIAVPHGTAPGEYHAVVWAQPPPNAGGAVTTVNRVGVRIYLSVVATDPGKAPHRDPNDGSDAFPWLLVVLPAGAVVGGVTAARASRRR